MAQIVNHLISQPTQSPPACSAVRSLRWPYPGRDQGRFRSPLLSLLCFVLVWMIIAGHVGNWGRTLVPFAAQRPAVWSLMKPRLTDTSLSTVTTLS